MLTVFSLLLFVSEVVNAVYASSHGRHIESQDYAKIVGGQEVTINKYPYQVYLLTQDGTDYFDCGGSIISPHFVLTAAHCVIGTSKVYIRAGSSNSDRGGKVYRSSTYTIHPKFNPQTLDNDIAVIRLLRKMRLDGTTTNAVKLPSSDTEVVPGENLIVTGWGEISENGLTPKFLNTVTIPVTTLESCNRTYSGKITDHMICAGTVEGGRDACQGDSGGPAVNETSLVQLGVVSAGIGCARPNVPGIYTNVVKERSWIQEVTGV